MPNISEINNVVLCNQIGVDNVLLGNINQIDNLSKSCDECNEIQLSTDRVNCALACAGSCTTWWTNGDPTSEPLNTGEYIYGVADCACEEVENEFYSSRCGGRGGYCYKVNVANCQIIAVVSC